jgi:hypothetical protein
MVRNWLWKLGLVLVAAVLWNHRLDIQRAEGGDVVYIVAAVLLGNALVLHWRPLTPVAVWAVSGLRARLATLAESLLTAPATRITFGSNSTSDQTERSHVR